MAGTKFVALSLICVILAVGCASTFVLLNQKEAEVELKTEQIVDMEQENNVLETQISGLLSENDALELQVSGLETQKSELNNEVTALESQISGLQTEVQNLEDEVVENYDLGYSYGESEGYEQGYDEGYSEGMDYMEENGYTIRNPTYAEAVAFINSDQTDKNQYTPDYVCYDFTSDFNYNAEEQGYRCGFVYITFRSSAHAIACFETVDEGLIYVEPQTDEIVDLAVGIRYNGEIIETLGIIW